MSKKEMLYKIIQKFPDLDIKKLEKIKGEVKKELEGKPPKIALIGETGVGKSTTINSIFNQGLEISHTVACTKEPTELEIDPEEFFGMNGLVNIIDMPGLGEDITSDEKHKSTYFKILPDCDVAVWILKADVRAISQVQIYLRDVVGEAMGGYDRIVIGLNQVDKIQPGKWNEKANIPSKEQMQNIDERVEDISQKIQTICEIPYNRIIPYSALKRYRLESLFWGMMLACPHKRSWVLHNRKALASFTDLVDHELLQSVSIDENSSNGGWI